MQGELSTGSDILKVLCNHSSWLEASDVARFCGEEFLPPVLDAYRSKLDLLVSAGLAEAAVTKRGRFPIRKTIRKWRATDAGLTRLAGLH